MYKINDIYKIRDVFNPDCLFIAKSALTLYCLARQICDAVYSFIRVI